MKLLVWGASDKAVGATKSGMGQADRGVCVA
jgi:hypothetical protein